MVIDTEKLQTLLAILRAAGASRYKCVTHPGGTEEFEVEFPPAQPSIVRALPLPPGTPPPAANDYDRVFHGQRPSFGSES